MKRAIIAALLAAACAYGAGDSILAAMRDELARSRAIRVAGLEPPYYIEYALDDADTLAVSASLGGIVSLRHEHLRYPEIKVRVGDYKFDNTNYAGGYFGGGYGQERFPLDNLYGLIRRSLWLSTDLAYKSALQTLSRKRAALRNVAVSEPLDDFARCEPLRYLRETQRQPVDETAWSARLRSLSAIFARYPAVKNSSLEFEAIQGTHYFANTEGSEVRHPESVAFLRVRALAQAPDGMNVRDATVFHAREFDRLPPEAALARGIEQVAQNATELARAPQGEDYSGPVLFEGVAAAQLFADALGRHFAIIRRPLTEPGRPGVFPYSELEGRQGARILPENFDVADDPTQAEWHGRPLFGAYAVDREGVASRPVVLVEKGVLKDFLYTRQPVRGHSGSNGHARMPGSYGANSAAISNLFVRAQDPVGVPELRRKLLEICQMRGKPYGMIVRKLDFPSSASMEEMRRLLAGSAQSGGARLVAMPLLVYKVFPDGREQLVRGLHFRGLNARTFKDVLAAAGDENIFEFLNNMAPSALMGAGGYVAESCVVAPSVLIDDLELHPTREELPKLPVVPSPL